MSPANLPAEMYCGVFKDISITRLLRSDGPLPETAHGPPAPNQTRLGRLAASASVCPTGHIRDLAYTGAKQLTTPSSPATKPKIFKLTRVLVDRGDRKSTRLNSSH